MASLFASPGREFNFPVMRTSRDPSTVYLGLVAMAREALKNAFRPSDHRFARLLGNKGLGSRSETLRPSSPTNCGVASVWLRVTIFQ